MRHPFKHWSIVPRSGTEQKVQDDTRHNAALFKLFAEHNHSLHSFLMTRTRNEQEAYEVAQEAYVRMLQLHHPSTVSFLRAYLFKTAVNIAVDRARQRSARTRLDQHDVVEEPVDSLSPDRRLIAKEELDLLEKALLELPEKYRRAFILSRFDERTTEDIGRELGINARMVRNYISRTTIYCKLRLQGLSPLQARMRVMP